MELTPGELREILKIFVESELRELQLEVGNVSLSVSKNEDGGAAMKPLAPASTQAVPQPSPQTEPEGTKVQNDVAATAAPSASEVDRSGLHALRSPLVGVFYRRPGPDQPPYVEVGDVIKEGDPVCTISVMKMFTEVGADRDGKVVEICVQNETLVEHGQVLMYIEPTAAD